MLYHMYCIDITERKCYCFIFYDAKWRCYTFKVLDLVLGGGSVRIDSRYMIPCPGSVTLWYSSWFLILQHCRTVAIGRWNIYICAILSAICQPVCVWVCSYDCLSFIWQVCPSACPSFGLPSMSVFLSLCIFCLSVCLPMPVCMHAWYLLTPICGRNFRNRKMTTLLQLSLLWLFSGLKCCNNKCVTSQYNK